MSDTAALGALAGVLKAADFGVFEPPTANGAAFQAVIASVGYGSVQTSEQLEIARTASVGRTPDEDGNIVPLVYLNGVPPGFTAALPRAVAASPTAAYLKAAHRMERGTEVLPDAATPTREIVQPNEELRFRRAPGITALQSEFGAAVIEPRSELHADVPQLAHGLKLIQTPIGGEALASIVSTPGPAPSPGVVLNAEAPFPLHHARFAEGLSRQVTMMASDGVQLARISINPPELGPVELRIVLRNEEAAVQLASQHGGVREALEQALPRLREQFEQAGMRLADSDVFSELPRESAEHQASGESIAAESAASELELAAIAAGSPLRVSRGFVDTYV